MDRILLVFIHGFRGSDTTFKEFPEHFRASLSDLLPRAHINLAVYPKFETRGSLSLATENFCTWLKGIEAQRRVQPGGESPLLTILVGHSMGGLLAGDAYLKYRQEPGGASNGFPQILGVLAFDSPFYGLNHAALTHSAYSKVTSLGTQLQSVAAGLGLAGLGVARSGAPAKVNRFKTLALGGLAVAAAATGAYVCRERLQTLYSYAMEHLDFVNALGRLDELNHRVQALVDCPEALFYCFYLQISRPEEKSCFIQLPGEANAPRLGADRFILVESGSEDLIHAHTTMFDPSHNPSYLPMTKQAVALTYRAIKQFQVSSAT